MNHAADCDCDECAFPKARKPPASLWRWTLRLAMIWAGFRMIADIIGKTIYGMLDLTKYLLNTVLYLLQIALYTIVVTGTGAALYWILRTAGLPVTF